MRLAILVGTISASGALLAATIAACGSDPASGGAGFDAGASSGSSGSTGDGGAELDGGPDADGGPATVATLRAGRVVLVGVTTDDLAVYLVDGGAGASNLEAVALAGGAPTVLATGLTATDRAFVEGGAVAWYTAVDANGIGTVNLWTKASGAKPALSTTSRVGLFSATADGARAAFSVGATATSTDLAVTDTAAPAATAVLTGANAINLAASLDCAPRLAFAGGALFGAYCNGTLAGANAARLVTVTPAGVAKRLDDANVNAAGTIRPFFSIDKAGDKVFVISAGGSRGHVILPATAPAAGGDIPVELDTEEGFLRDDGSAVIYRTGVDDALKRATTADPPVIVTLVATGVKEVLAVDKTQSRVLFHTLDPATADDLVDLRSLDTTPAVPTPPVDIVPTAAAAPVGFSADGASILYFSDLATGSKLKTQPAGGGPEQLLALDIGAAMIAPDGSGVVLVTDDVVQGQETLLTLAYVDTLVGGAPHPIADHVPQGAYRFSGRKFVFARTSETSPGLFRVDLP
jgi:hypothetical protein